MWKECKRPTRVNKPLGHWSKNQNFPKEGEDYANAALAYDPTTLSEALKCNDVDKWKATMENKYHSYLANGS